MAVREYFLQMMFVNENDADTSNQYLVAGLTDGTTVIPLLFRGRRKRRKLRDKLYEMMESPTNQFIIRTTRSEFMKAKTPWNVVFMGGQLKKQQYAFVDAVLRDIATEISTAHPVRNPIVENVDATELVEPEVTSPKTDSGKLEFSVENLLEDPTDVYTDASAAANKAAGVYGWVKKAAELNEVTFDFHSSSAGNINWLEIAAIAEAIASHKQAKRLTVHSDSLNAVTLFNSFAGASVSAITVELQKYKVPGSVIGRVVDAVKAQRIVVTWVRSHENDTWNVCADQMVRYARNRSKKLHHKPAVRLEIDSMLHNLLLNR